VVFAALDLNHEDGKTTKILFASRIAAGDTEKN
jgi:hypothetical protein